MTMNKKRDLTLDAAKGLLILMVVYAHCFTDGMVHDYIFAFHMPAFFVISGMTAGLSMEIEKPFAKTILKLLRTLGIPFVFFELLGVAQELIRYGFALSWKGYLFNSLTMQCNNIVNWFLYALLAAKMISICTRRFLAHIMAQDVADIGYLAISVLAMIAAVNFADKTSIIIRIVLKIVVAHGFYAIGLRTASCNIGRKYLIGGICLISAFVLSCLNEGYADLNELHFGDPLIFFTAALSGTCGILLLRRKYCCKPLVWLGQNSLIVMGTHIPILLLARFATGTTEPTLLHRAGDMALILLLSVPIAYLVKNFAPFLVGKRKKPRQTVCS